jgi:hypothetical protein
MWGFNSKQVQCLFCTCASIVIPGTHPKLVLAVQYLQQPACPITLLSHKARLALVDTPSLPLPFMQAGDQCLDGRCHTRQCHQGLGAMGAWRH